MGLLFLFAPPALGYLSQDNLPKLSSLCYLITLIEVVIGIYLYSTI